MSLWSLSSLCIGGTNSGFYTLQKVVSLMAFQTFLVIYRALSLAIITTIFPALATAVYLLLRLFRFPRGVS